MEIFILVLMLIISAIYLSYIIANSKVMEYLTKKELVIKNSHNFLAILTSLSIFIIYSFEKFEPIIKDKFLRVLLISYLLIFVFIITLIFLTNIIANKFAKAFKKALEPFSYIALVVFYPLTFIFSLLSKKLLYVDKEKMSEDQFLEIIEQAEELDGITESESKLIKSVLEFDEMKITDIYTPRTDVLGIKKGEAKEVITKTFIESGFSRLPLYEDDIDNIIGIINYKDFSTKVLMGQKNIEDIIQKPVEVTEYMKINNLLSLLKLNKSHIAIVKDEFGGTLGIVTMEDVLEELVGDIFDEHDVVVEDIKRIAPNKYLILGSTYIQDVNDLFGSEIIEDDDFLTINGWVIGHLEKVGQKGDTFTYKNLEVEVTKATNKKVLEVFINILDYTIL